MSIVNPMKKSKIKKIPNEESLKRKVPNKMSKSIDLFFGDLVQEVYTPVKSCIYLKFTFEMKMP